MLDWYDGRTKTHPKPSRVGRPGRFRRADRIDDSVVMVFLVIIVPTSGDVYVNIPNGTLACLREHVSNLPKERVTIDASTDQFPRPKPDALPR